MIIFSKLGQVAAFNSISDVIFIIFVVIMVMLMITRSDVKTAQRVVSMHLVAMIVLLFVSTCAFLK